jgi:outer membrane protein OmpA-like peptidoglycan-associated protein
MPAVFLDGFEVGDYRLRPPHYEPLLRVVLLGHAASGQPNTAVVIVAEGHADDTGLNLMNFGLSFSRALEVSTNLEGWFRRLGDSVVVSPLPIGENPPLVPNTTPAGRRRNRSVVLTLCVVRRIQQPILT